MAQPRQQPRVRNPIPDGFVFDALRLQNALRDADLVDRVAARHPRLQSFACIALPQHANATCSQSVLAFATQLTKKTKDENTHALLNRVDDLTLPQMRRTLERLGLAHFPIYVLGPRDDDAGPKFIAARGTKHREDNWAIVYIPQELNFGAHWTFTKIQPIERDVTLPHVRSVLMYTEIPIQPRQFEFWRARVTQNNVQSFYHARAAGRACCCNYDVVCQHEVEFVTANPDAICVSFLGGTHVEKTWRAQALKSPGFQMCADYSVQVQNGQETVTVPFGHSCESTMDVGNFAPPYSIFNYALFHRARDTASSTGTIIEVPEEITDVTVGGLAFRVIRLPRRRHVWGPIAIGLHILSPLIPFMSRSKFWVHHVTSLYEPQILLNEAVDVRWDSALRHASRPMEYMALCWAKFTTMIIERLPAFLRSRFRPTATLDVNKIVHSAQNVSSSALATVLRYFAPSRNRFTDMLYVFARKYMLSVSWVVLCAYCTYLFIQGVRALYIRLMRKRLVTDVPIPRTAPYGYTDDLTLQLPDERQLKARLASLPEVTQDHAFDILRRLSAETNWQVDFNRSEIGTWIERVVTTPGKTRNTLTDVKDCLNCKERPRSYRLLCKICWSRLRNSPLVDLILTDTLVTYVGMLPIRSEPFVFPEITLKDGCYVKVNGKQLFNEWTPDHQFKTWYAQQHVQYGYRGRNCGPLFLRQRPSCFARGHETAVIAFCLRLGAANRNELKMRYFDATRAFIESENIHPIEPEGREIFLSHFRGEKLQKMLDAERSINAGNARLPDPNSPTPPECHMKGFTKAEKSYRTEYEYYYLTLKPTMKPRFICCPSPEFLFTIGPYTHAQTKWLSAAYQPRSHLYYAGCSTPAELNEWLNFTHHDLGGAYISIADDISAIDSCHTEHSMQLHATVRQLQFPSLPANIEVLYQAEHILKIRLGKFTMRVSFVNGSGVSDTSYKNSLLCLFIRLLALTNAVRSLDELDFTDFLSLTSAIRSKIYTTASGDDGLTRTPRNLFGTDLTTLEAQDRYSAYWGAHGFSVKVKIYSEVEWRMATYLANRPIYAGSGLYEWMPEPARRLRGLFWQIDNSMHPLVWGRSVATGLKAIAAGHPVLGPVADWYLANTYGPVVPVQIFGNPYNPFQGHRSTCTEVQQRAIDEFLVDYGLLERDYTIFLSAMRSAQTVFVNFETRLVHQLFRLES